MQKGVFTTWIKELCALVFVQTIQAFILAIVLSIILTFLFPETKDGVATITEQNSVSALGVLCIILLTSLTKMEQITKKIFGLESGILENKPPHGLMASFLALKAAGKVLNNVPKMIGGIGTATFGTALDKKKAHSAHITRLDRRGLNGDGTPKNGEEPQVNPDTGGENNLLDSTEYYEKAKASKREGDMNGYNKNIGIAAGINKANKAIASNPPAPISANATTPSRLNKNNDKDREAVLKSLDKYDDELAKAKEKRRKGIDNLVSGAAETIGAGIGGSIGGSIGLVSGLSTGDLDQPFKAAAYGMGVGDSAGENLSKAVTNATRGLKSRSNINKKLNSQLDDMERKMKINNEKRGSQAKRVRNINQKLMDDFGIKG